MEVFGWGRYPRIDATLVSPRSVDELRRRIQLSSGITLRGHGKSYGDSALGESIADSRNLDHLQSFGEPTGVLRCEAGTTLADLAATFLPRGWFLPVTPGTAHISVGGAIASDVHGKNHHLHGCFSEFVDSFRLLMADGDLLHCSRNEHPDLFHATCGGMGLTGALVDVTLRLRRVPSAWIDQVTCKANNLEEAFELFEQQAAATYSVAWIDCLANGASLGRSLLMFGEHSSHGGLELPPRRALAVPLEMPSALLNHYSVRVFNSLYFQRIRQPRVEQRVDYRSFFYPLDGIGDWNRMYGRNGFLQYQFVIPASAGLPGMRRILERIAASGRGSFLAVLKAFGEGNENPLSFPQKGYTLALDFKMDASLLPLLDELDRMVLDHGGRLYLAKDARMSAATFKQSYPRWENFQEIRERYGALGKFTSLQARRLGLD
ncbi:MULTISPECIES: FAD-binding protein [Pseudomonas aeruginosa group]|uniref:FAD-binding protein n=1 Tax=Pseudomonas aeruginosa group TaxID=136841 RepID=UPI000D14EDEF|nr:MULTISPECIES: FAD-binding oxidoreductase [Pseudomonas aeruginosa group]AVR70610.1 FAD-linked oxidase [Pseudomonas paraeruginosa]MBG3906217.1 FAD-binding oxidoreductase [Pseudomonas aeruginosa]MBG4204361.1 FAD-binding oxidoreductase [Pseudomonas aeruginosa]MBG4278561.1 FAD-binding oxidoreductase [Pseudomonas aeruginosa]MBG6892722.1 FAD-binding oxidoreductase [Pseudomonas aeruginosa]